MLRIDGPKDVQFCDGLKRRDFLQVGAIGALGLNLAATAAKPGSPERRQRSCILLFLVGGPSQLDTWDLKPDAPADIRGPFQPIATNVPGISICEHFPRMAALADRYALLRSVYHKEAPIHETGHQLMQSGWLFRGGTEFPSYGSVLAKTRPSRDGVPPYVVMPGPIGNTGVNVPHGQSAGFLGERFDPYYVNLETIDRSSLGDVATARLPDPARTSERHELLAAVDEAQRRYDARIGDADTATQHAFNRVFSSAAKHAFELESESPELRARYGQNTFGQSCLLARRLVEQDVRMITVNMFDTVFNRTTWDCHANGGSLAVTLDDYKRTLCPMFDAAYSTLLEDLAVRGMLDDTLVIAMGEFGRTYKINTRGGRDHWPNVWSIVLAGGGVRGGQVIGSSDRYGAEPKDRPIHPSEIAATVYQAMGVDLSTRFAGPSERLLPLVSARPIDGLLAS